MINNYWKNCDFNHPTGFVSPLSIEEIIRRSRYGDRAKRNSLKRLASFAHEGTTTRREAPLLSSKVD